MGRQGDIPAADRDRRLRRVPGAAADGPPRPPRRAALPAPRGADAQRDLVSERDQRPREHDVLGAVDPRRQGPRRSQAPTVQGHRTTSSRCSATPTTCTCRRRRPTSVRPRCAAAATRARRATRSTCSPRTSAWCSSTSSRPTRCARPAADQRPLARLPQHRGGQRRPAARCAVAAGVGQRPERFRRSLAAIVDERQPTLDFLHVLLPHEPLEYLPSGQGYQQGREHDSSLDGPPSYDNAFLTDQAFQRHLLPGRLHRPAGRRADRPSLKATGLGTRRWSC